jgi:hypothetical protein
MGFLLCFCPYLKTEPAWAAGSYQVNGTSITVSAGTNEDVYSVMKSATEYARDHNSSSTIYTIKLVAGDYKLSNAIRVYGNVKLDLTGVTLHYVGDTNNMLMLGNASTNSNPVYASEYGLRHNITVIGGILVMQRHLVFIRARILAVWGMAVQL